MEPNSFLFLDSNYQRLFAIVVLVLCFLGLMHHIFVYKRKLSPGSVAQHSVKSWLIVTPVLFFVASLPQPWPVYFLTLVSVFGVKAFFKMSGVYHRSNFVLSAYIFVVILSVLAWKEVVFFYNLIPMVFVALIGLIPIIKNESKKMVQYISLSTLGFLITGWSFLHLIFFLKMPDGLFSVIVFLILSEINFSVFHYFSSYASRSKRLQEKSLLSNISSRFSWLSIIVSLVVTVVFSWLMRDLLPREQLWLFTGFIIGLCGHLGDLFLSLIRRDMGVPGDGIFIIGRNDILARMSKFFFTAPALFYVYVYYGLFSI